MSKIIFFSLLLLAISACSDSEPTPRPNVLFILVDDLGYHDLSVTGSTFYETPHVDALARRGTQFTQAYTASRVCSPARASIMLGKFTARHGITDWIGAKTDTSWAKLGRATSHLPPEYVRNLPQEDTTLTEAFAAAGYTTFHAGKWHLGDAANRPEQHGYAMNVGGWHKGSPSNGYFDPYENETLPNRKPGENLSLRLALETSKFITTAASEDVPFFATLNFYAVHGPLQTTREKWAYYRRKALETGVPATTFEMERRYPIRTTQDNPVYAGLVEHMDEAVGTVLRTLDSLSLTDNTIVVFTSDHGGVASGDGYSTTNAPLRGGKGYQWEGGLRVPLFIAGPSFEAAVQRGYPVIHTDLYPTLLEAADLPLRPEQHLDGVSIRTVPTPRAMIWHYPHYGNQGGEPGAVILRDPYKLIHYYEDGHNELYNLDQDIGERNDLAKTDSIRVADMQRELFRFLEANNVRYPRPDPNFDPAARKKRLQYLSGAWLQRLEERRTAMFEEGWEPDSTWYGSVLE